MDLALPVKAALRLSPEDSIGVPILMSGNAMYIPEMDADFNILNFMEFLNLDGFKVVYDIPKEYTERLFRIGDPAPIILWVEGKSFIVEGDAEPAVLASFFGQSFKAHPVLLDLKKMLHAARTGAVREKHKVWLAEEIERSFGEVFLEPPTRTKYWISRYRMAIEDARKITQPPHPIDVRLRRASAEWLRKFATKAEFPMIKSLLGDASQGVYSIGRIREIVYAYVCHRLNATTAGILATLASDQTVRSLFPGGLYLFYIENGVPKVPFKWSQPDFVALMSFMMSVGYEKSSWKMSIDLSKVLFGGSDAPDSIDEMGVRIIRRELNDYRDAYQRLDREIPIYIGDPIHQREQDKCDLAIMKRAYRNISSVSQVILAADRRNGSMMDGRFSVALDEVNRFSARINPPGWIDHSDDD